MSIRYVLTAYCDDCGFDVSETDTDDLETDIDSFERRCDILFLEHVKQGKCNGEE